MISRGTAVPLVFLLCIVFFASPALAFGAGNIPTLARVEGQNFRHGDIEDTLKKLVYLKGAKWTSKLIKKVYFGNWLRDYSQAVDVGTVKSVNPQSIRILVWILAFMSFGFATGEFEVTEERLGVYRPEEHIDNPKDYADNQDARLYDARLRPPVHPTELAVDPQTCMKNYIANENLGIATSTGYIKHSLNRSIHFGRLYTSGPPGDVNNETHLNEALRCLGQALHTLEDFSAHSNYVELVLREMGMLSIFPHVGAMTQMVLPNGKALFPLTTGTFGGVDFLHSVIGEAQDKFTQTELQEMDGVLAQAHEDNKKSGSRHTQTSILKDLLSKIPNCAGLAAQADSLEQAADAKELQNLKIAHPDEYGSKAAQRKDGEFDPVKLSRDIYPILEFRDNAVKTIAAAIDSITEQIPGFPDFTELMDTISDQLSIYVFSVLSPYIRPVIQQAQMELKVGSTEVLSSAKNHQYEVWSNAYSTDPTHSMLSKDHFSNVLNAPAGQVAARVVEYVVPRVLFAWENVNADIGLILFDIIKVLHHPGLRDPNTEIQMAMFEVVRTWADAYPGGHPALEMILNSEAIKAGKNHKGGVGGDCGHGKLKGGEWDKAERVKNKKKGSSSKGKKEDTIKIGGVRIPTGGLGRGAGILGGGALETIAGAAFAGYTGGTFEEKKDKSRDKDKEKSKDKDKEKKDKKDKDEKDKYGSLREKDKDKERKHKDEDEEKRRKKEKEKEHLAYGSYSHGSHEDEEKRHKKEREKEYLAYGGYSQGAHYEREEKERKEKKEKEKKEKSGSPTPYYTQQMPGAYYSAQAPAFDYSATYSHGHVTNTSDSKNRDKDKDKSKSKDKHRSSGRDYSDDEDSHRRSYSRTTHSSGKHRSPSSPSKRGHSPKRSPSRDYHRKHATHEYEFQFEKRREDHHRRNESPTEQYHAGVTGGHPYYEEGETYDYDYRPPVRSPLPEGHQIDPYGVPSHISPHTHAHAHIHHEHGRSRSSSRVRNEYVEVEYAVPVPLPPPPPPQGYLVEDGEDINVVRARYSRTEQDEGCYGAEGHKGYGEGWNGAYGKDYGY
ncbi:heterokaryon incompatibility protein Het-C-domain-containing protein [Terfezia claveryi]|nr:heterokaryon incompatibility protein Het-C-domain-containing protein [Terfezia claveryi]